MSQTAWLDVSVFRCPKCRRCYADASWYIVESESDIECGGCQESLDAEKELTDRIMLEFKIDEKGEVLEAGVVKHISES